MLKYVAKVTTLLGWNDFSPFDSLSVIEKNLLRELVAEQLVQERNDQFRATTKGMTEVFGHSFKKRIEKEYIRADKENGHHDTSC